MKFSTFQIIFIFSCCISISLSLRYECHPRNNSCGCGFKDVEIANDLIHQLDKAIPHSWSMIVSIQYDCHQNDNPSTHCCSGTIVNDRYILTSASCFQRNENRSLLAKDVSIIAGIHFLEQQCQIHRMVDEIIIHPNWTGQTEDIHDLALLRLTKRLDLPTEYLVTRSCLASDKGDITTNYGMNTTVAVVGWNISSHLISDEDQVLRQMPFYTDDFSFHVGLIHIARTRGKF